MIKAINYYIIILQNIISTNTRMITILIDTIIWTMAAHEDTRNILCYLIQFLLQNVFLYNERLQFYLAFYLSAVI